MKKKNKKDSGHCSIKMMPSCKWLNNYWESTARNPESKTVLDCLAWGNTSYHNDNWHLYHFPLNGNLCLALLHCLTLKNVFFSLWRSSSLPSLSTDPKNESFHIFPFMPFPAPLGILRTLTDSGLLSNWITLIYYGESLASGHRKYQGT